MTRHGPIVMYFSGLNTQMHHSWEHLGILSPWDIVRLDIVLHGFLSLWGFVPMGFCPPGLLSHLDFVPLGFCPHGILSSWVFVFLGFCPLGYCPMGFCPVGFCPRTIYIYADRQVYRMIKTVLRIIDIGSYFIYSLYVISH